VHVLSVDDVPAEDNGVGIQVFNVGEDRFKWDVIGEMCVTKEYATEKAGGSNARLA
jgi:hypothetical protein